MRVYKRILLVSSLVTVISSIVGWATGSTAYIYVSTFWACLVFILTVTQRD